MVVTAPLLERIGDFAGLLDADEDEAAVMAIRRSRSTGRPVGAADWIKALEAQTERTLAPARRGPKAQVGELEQLNDLFHTVSP